MGCVKTRPEDERLDQELKPKSSKDLNRLVLQASKDEELVPKTEKYLRDETEVKMPVSEPKDFAFFNIKTPPSEEIGDILPRKDFAQFDLQIELES